MDIDISVVIATHNQKERLRLVLSGLRYQRFPRERFEIVVVDDGCTDGTGDMLTVLSQDQDLNIQVVSLMSNVGRCQARNIGVQKAQGRLVAFLDGDALPHPDWLARHTETWERHRHNSSCYLCGFLYSLPRLEYIRDPQNGMLMEGTPSVLADYLQLHRDEVLISEEMIQDNFTRIHQQAREGGYPFDQLKTMQNQIVELFQEYPNSPIGWIGFTPHNAAVSRQAFLEAGHFDPYIPFSEGWDFAYRLQQIGLQPIFVEEAATYHLYHYHGFSDPQKMDSERSKRFKAIAYMARKNCNAKMLLVKLWYAGIWPDPFIPEEWILRDALHFHERYLGISTSELRDLQKLLRSHPEWSFSHVDGD